MHCPICNANDTKVIDSRLLHEGTTIRRRRKCESCEKRFTTYEKLEEQMPAVVKGDGRREAFNKEKILGGIKKSCHKSPIPTIQFEEMFNKIKKSIKEKYDKEVPARAIGDEVMDWLFQLDPVAYVRYASFYWRYDNINDFLAELQESLNQREETLKRK